MLMLTRRRSCVSNGLNWTGRLQTAIVLEERISYWESAQTGLTGLPRKCATPILLIILTSHGGSERTEKKKEKN